MSTEQLVSALKEIVSLAKAGDVEQAYTAYRTLFSSPGFRDHRPEDQRQALKLMIHAKGVAPTPAIVEAHRAAIGPLTALVSAHGEPIDHELLGICHLSVGNPESASEVFKAGLAIERERDPSSDLCGTLMKRISLI